MNYHVNYFELQLVFDESLWPGIRLTNSTSEPLFNSADTPTGNNELQRRQKCRFNLQSNLSTYQNHGRCIPRNLAIIYENVYNFSYLIFRFNLQNIQEYFGYHSTRLKCILIYVVQFKMLMTPFVVSDFLSLSFLVFYQKGL